MKGILLLALLAVLAHLLESWRSRLRDSRSNSQESTVDEERLKEQEKVERTRIQREHELKAEDYTERILKPRRDAKRQQQEEKMNQFSGPLWKGAAHALGGADNKDTPRTRDGSSTEAALLRQLPEEVLHPPTPPSPPKTSPQRVIVLPEEPEEGATDSVSIVLRTFQGRRHTRRFRTSDPVQVLLDYMTTIGYHQKVYTLMTSFPRHDLSNDPTFTLLQLDLTRAMVLNVEEKDASLNFDSRLTM
ncbi:hypothetical protein NP493_347g03081 [Ridgeia piscesae]|uniref:UBX domain-containing protein n=1 Tax=Ridgeia piscesae TaxID=27915 RepID=A0AAD9NVK5_RIDPI|nr:hypothetical protein NP493_347g03081 [Ridgeia piscesae]